MLVRVNAAYDVPSDFIMSVLYDADFQLSNLVYSGYGFGFSTLILTITVTNLHPKT